jgi:3-methyladenine DNA glycosylase Tag
MTLSNKEKIIAIISNGIAVYSLYQERGNLPENTTMFDFILKAVPDEIKSELSAELIDEVFEYVSSAHSS